MPDHPVTAAVNAGFHFGDAVSILEEHGPDTLNKLCQAVSKYGYTNEAILSFLEEEGPVAVSGLVVALKHAKRGTVPVEVYDFLQSHPAVKKAVDDWIWTNLGKAAVEVEREAPVVFAWIGRKLCALGGWIRRWFTSR